MNVHLIDLSPLVQLLLLGALVAAGPLLWQAWRLRGQSTPARLRALTLLTLFLTFDLVLFGAYTRLTDSGLGCPDWPGCYGSASPLGAQAEITQAQSAMPTGPVTHGKAWVEMVHRYLASGVGALITVLMVWSWRASRRRDLQGSAADGTTSAISPAWAALCFVWVVMQGAFGALTVTMKLYPAIVTAHLLGGIGLLALLAVQATRYGDDAKRITLSPTLRRAAAAVLVLVIAQASLGGWVSTNYAVLACSDFPTCQGAWWPDADFDAAFQLRRELGQRADGSTLPFAALTAIHLTHRIAAVLVSLAVVALAVSLRRHAHPNARRYGLVLALLLLWQLATGISNVVLDWPLLAAVSHTGGAAVLVAVLASLLAAHRVPARAPSPDTKMAADPVRPRHPLTSS